MKQIKQLLIASAFIFSLAACEKEVTKLNEDSTSTLASSKKTLVPNDYFPLNRSYMWSYFNRYYSGDSIAFMTDTNTYSVSSDTTINGKSYTLFKDSRDQLSRGIRKEKGNYYSIDIYRNNPKEHLFLRDDRPVGCSWQITESNTNGQYKYVYTIAEKAAEKTVRGRTYKDVIEVVVKVYLREGGQFNLWATIITGYAKGVGEIYKSIPYPLSGTYADVQSELIEFSTE